MDGWKASTPSIFSDDTWCVIAHTRDDTRDDTREEWKDFKISRYDLVRYYFDTTTSRSHVLHFHLPRKEPPKGHNYTLTMSSVTEGTPLLGLSLAVDSAAFDLDIASEWGWILAGGILSLIAGIFALMSPITTTFIAIGFISCALIVIGGFMMMSVCFIEQCYRLTTFLVGALQLALGILMATHTLTSLMVLTSVVAVMFLLDGIFRCAVGLNNKDMSGWVSYLVSGICSILFSIIVWSALPASSVYTLGILLGVNWVTYGFLRIILGFAGRSTAKSLMAAGGSNV